MEIKTSTSNIDFSITVKLSEQEARALLAMTVYGTKEFLEFFYKHMGKTSLGPHEVGLAKLFETAKEELPKHFNKFDKVREVLAEPLNK